MLCLQFEFLASRYHATPWGHQVNEGQVAWPPSPWRLLRAVVAGWHRIGAPETEPAARTMLGKLAESDPVYWLPPHTQAHTRHYMPTDSGNTLVFDAFVQFEDKARLTVGFPGVELTPDEGELLARCVAHLGYLGRAESWVLGSVAELDGAPGTEVRPGRVPGAGLLPAAMGADEYAAWAKDARQRYKKKSEKPPGDLWGALNMGTDAHQKGRWSRPPGQRVVAYDLDRVAPLYTSLPRRSSASLSRVARFALVPIDGVLPRFVDGLRVAEVMHRALAKRAEGADVGLLTGMRDGEVLRDKGHAHLCWSSEVPGRVTHLHVTLPSYQPHGQGALATHAFSDVEVGTLRTLNRLYVPLPGRGGGVVPYRLVLEGLWSDDDLRTLRELRRAPPLLQVAQEWVSETPVLLPRHPKIRQGSYVKDSPCEQVADSLARAGFPSAEVELDTSDRGRWAPFVRRRRGLGPGRGGVGVWSFRIRFSEPVAGPVAVGALSHFGMGRFEPDSK